MQSFKKYLLEAGLGAERQENSFVAAVAQAVKLMVINQSQ